MPGAFDLSTIPQWPAVAGNTGTQLYSLIVSSTAGCGVPVFPHHPLVCDGMGLTEEGLACPHAKVPMDDERLQAALDMSVAAMIMEGAFTFKGMECLPNKS